MRTATDAPPANKMNNPNAARVLLSGRADGFSTGAVGASATTGEVRLLQRDCRPQQQLLPGHLRVLQNTAR